MKENIVQTKSYAFAIKIVNTYKFLIAEKKEFVLSKQMLRSGTSVGANIEEAIGGQSRKDFYAKLTISYKEARETKYWIRLLTDTHYLTTAQSEPLLNDIEELLEASKKQYGIRIRNYELRIRNYELIIEHS